jgi:deoxyribonuclease V
MRLAISHRWDLTVTEAKALQAELANQVVRETTFDAGNVRTVAGVDVGIRRSKARAAVVVLRFPHLDLVDYALAELPVTFPYVPGLLAFREGPSVIAALEKIRRWPDVFVFDAQGLAHPRRIGLASHLGVILDEPSIGCAKSRLIGKHAEPGKSKGEWVPLQDNDEVIGSVVRSRTGVKPLFVSIGHRVDLEAAIEFVLRCCTKYRLPETTRYAHKLASDAEMQPLLG